MDRQDETDVTGEGDAGAGVGGGEECCLVEHWCACGVRHERVCESEAHDVVSWLHLFEVEVEFALERAVGGVVVGGGCGRRDGRCGRGRLVEAHR